MPIGDTKTKIKKVDTMTKEQAKVRKKAIKQVDVKTFDLEKNPLFKHGKQFLTEMMDPSSQAYQRFEAPYMRKFRESAGQMQAKFGGDQSRAMGLAAKGQEQRFSENMASMRTQSMMNASGQALGYAQAPGQMNANLLNQSLQAQPFGYQVTEPYERAGTKIMKGLAKGAIVAGATALGGQAGGAGAATFVNSI